jgi:hypothetical protein
MYIYTYTYAHKNFT